MSNGRNSMKPVVIGGAVAALVIAAFALGMAYQQEQTTPAEKIGQSLGDAAQALKEGVEKGAEK